MTYEIHSLRSGLRQRAPASLTPAKRLNFRLSKSAENWFVAARGAVLGDGHTSGCAYQVPIVAHGGVVVCDGWPGRL
jgi:hypothetical protein